MMSADVDEEVVPPSSEPHVGGGHRIVRRGAVVDRPVRTLDVAPTVAGLFGLDHGGMDGRPVLEAFHY